MLCSPMCTLDGSRWDKRGPGQHCAGAANPRSMGASNGPRWEDLLCGGDATREDCCASVLARGGQSFGSLARSLRNFWAMTSATSVGIAVRGQSFSSSCGMSQR